MDWLKRHYEKVVLALALLALIGTAAVLALKVQTLTKEVHDTPVRPPQKGKPVRHVGTELPERAIKSLNAPPQWSLPAKDIFPAYAVELPPDVPPPQPVRKLFTLQNIIRERFKYIFRAYTWDAGAQKASTFQINSLVRARAFFVPSVGEPIPDPTESNKYVVVKFERKIVLMDVPGIRTKQERDLSEITIQQPGMNPVTLVLNQVAEPNPAALVVCGMELEPRRLARGDTFACAGKTYKVVDITPTQVLIEDVKTGAVEELKQ